MRQFYRWTAFAVLCLSVSPLPASAHDTTRKVVVPVQTRQVQGRAAKYQVGFACLPPDAVTDELVVCEVKVAPPQAGVEVTIEVAEPHGRVALPVHHEAQAGVYGAEHRFTAAGTYAASVRVGQEPPVGFSIGIGTGLVERMRWLSAILLLLVAAWGGRRLLRPRFGSIAGANRRTLAGAGAYVIAMLVCGVAADRVVVPAAGRALLPARSDGAVDWGDLDGGEVQEHAEDVTAPPGTRDMLTRIQTGPSTSAPATALTGRVVARPGAIVDVFVPMTGRVVFTKELLPRVGAHVVAGQTLALLEQHYVTDESVHLINARWPILVEMLAAKRRMLEDTANAERSQFLYEHESVPLKTVQDARAAAAVATSEYERWRDNLTKHDAQIGERDPVTRPVIAPATGTIASATFTQGQLVYEGSKLFTIAEVSTVWVRLDVPEQLGERARASLGQAGRVEFSTVASGGEGFTGRFVKSTPVVDEATRTVPFFFEVANSQKRLKLGMGVSARVDPTAPQTPITPSRSGRSLTAPVIATGVIAADPQLQAEVVAPMWGRIEFAHQPLSVGDRVNKGDELARLVLELPIGERYAVETRRGEIAAALDQARKRKELVDLDYRRAVALFRSNHDDLFRKRQVEWTEEIYRSAVQEEATIAAQSAAFANVIKRRDPKITVVTAPLAGTIADIAFTPGELDETQQFRRLFTIVDLSRVWIVADVFEKDIEAIRTCRSASFTPAGGTARALGLPLVIADSLDEKTRTLRVIFQVPNPTGSLRLGAFASLIFDIE
jgi:multidrug efflux pump subunit AcrA (membrane-fusion protein)